MTQEQLAAFIAGMLAELKAEAFRDGYEAAREQAAKVAEQVAVKFGDKNFRAEGALAVAAAIREMKP